MASYWLQQWTISGVRYAELDDLFEFVSIRGLVSAAKRDGVDVIIAPGHATQTVGAEGVGVEDG